jgi:succinoglycan biosynthesis transport protein ExoP
MRRGRGKLPVLAEIPGLAADGDRVWSLRRSQLEPLAAVGERIGSGGVVLVSGNEGLVPMLAIALAAHACAGGREVALLDCELERPRLAADLGLAETPGLHEYLRWEAEPEELLQTLTLAGPGAGESSSPVVCIAAGRPATNPSVLLGLQSFRHMIARLRGAYELVLVAGPALDAGRSGLEALGVEADAVLAAVSEDEVAGRGRRALAAKLGRLRTEVLGAVVVGGEAEEQD